MAAQMVDLMELRRADNLEVALADTSVVWMVSLMVDKSAGKMGGMME